MSPEHSYNPFNNSDFRKEMSEMFDEKLADMPELIREHEEYIQQQKGGGRLLSYVWTGVLAVFGGWFGSKVR
jgi:hypothetical protein